MVLLGADERRISRPRAGAARTLLLPVAALDSGPGPEPLPSAAPEGQARKPQQCVGGGGVRPRLGTAGGRGRPRRDDHPGDGESHAARLRDRRRCGDAAGPGAGDSSLQPQARDALVAELRLGRGADRRLDVALDQAEAQLESPDESGARRLVESLALALQGSLLVRHSPQAVAGAFCATRTAGDHGYAFGSLPAGIETGAILERAWPE